MKQATYFRLMKDGHFVGFKRIIAEYLPAGFDRWQLTPTEHDPEVTQRLDQPAVGIAALKREHIKKEDEEL